MAADDVSAEVLLPRRRPSLLKQAVVGRTGLVRQRQHDLLEVATPFGLSHQTARPRRAGLRLTVINKRIDTDAQAATVGLPVGTFILGEPRR